ncbi:MAG: hypothetical protein RIC55_13290 [Pirellulaceae bacterium]
MKNAIRNVRDIDQADRQALEHVLGQPLHENQQLVIGIVDLEATQPKKPQAGPGAERPALPDWCNVYAGLTDDQVADLEESILTRADLSRPSE